MHPPTTASERLTPPFLRPAPAGTLNNPDPPKGTRATVYAVYSSPGSSAPEFVGVTRSLPQSLRMQLGRQPLKTQEYASYHLTRPSRDLLSSVRSAWLSECGGAPGNDDGEGQKGWEGATDVWSMMTDEDREAIEAGKQASAVKEMSAVKKVCRRFENEKVAALKERGYEGEIRFCPKLKGEGLLDFWTKREKDSVPTGKPGGEKKKK